MNLRKFTRKDQCFFVGNRAWNLTPGQAATAWYHFSEWLREFGKLESGRFPKYADLMHAARAATIIGHQHPIIYETNQLHGDGKAVSEQDQDSDQAAWLAIPENRRDADGSEEGPRPQAG